MFQTVTDSFAIGNETAPEALRQIHDKGYRTIVDLCTPEEGNQLNPEEMKKLDFEYIRVPVHRQHLNSKTLQGFIEAVNCASQPIYTRCASGLRAGVMTLLSLASREGWTEQQYLQQRQMLGIDFNPKSPVEAYALDYFRKESA